ncbi:MAG: phosphorylase [Desulfuromonadaceae bacterium]|nr:phosphorylase [Desulfuromonadaceae bacterium]
MKIAAITAMPEEFNAVSRTLGTGAAMQLAGLKAVRCRTAGHDIILLESGMGFDNAARAAEALIREEKPDLLISVGFCGGIAPELNVGDVVVAQRIVIAAGSGIEEVPVLFSAAGQAFVAHQAGARVFGGTFAGTPVITSKERLAAMLPAGSPFPVVEMESAAIATIAVGSGIPLLALRAVSDPAGEELGFSLDEFCDARMRIRPHRVLLTILRKPRIIPQLIRLARNSRVAAHSLTAAMEQLLPLL